jgi:dTDP-4-dehydrorhamnose 3,5-epimerase
MPLRIETTELGPVAIVTGPVFLDDRGSFRELGRQSEFETLGFPPFVQENESRSRSGVLRGLHYQLEPYAQGKLVRAVSGSIWDVAVDIRASSPTFLHWFGLHLTDSEPTMLWVPPGFAHGFLVLTEGAIVQYWMTAEYNADSERSIAPMDPAIGIEWPGLNVDVVLSDKDAAAPLVVDADVFP